MPSLQTNPQEVRRELARVLASPRFARNERMSRFLRFLIDQQLEGQTSSLKESVIAVEVFGRKPDYDPKSDSIVRTEAARLRARLAEYYAHEGSTDPVTIEIPKGGYVPLLTRRSAPQMAARRVSPLTVILYASLAALVVLGAWSLVRPWAAVRIAVLPLEDLTGSNPQSNLADGLTDELIRNLAVIDGLEVRSRTSSFVFRTVASRRDVRDVGARLGVDYLLDGSVARAGDRLRVDAQLVRVRDDVTVWSDRFDRPAADIFGIEDDISLAIVNSLRVRLGRGRRRYETSVEAYDAYLRADVLTLPGQAYGDPGSEVRAATPAERFDRSIRAYEDAIARDRSFAPAFAGLAYVYAVRSVQFPLRHPPDELTAMRAAGERALQLDPLLPDAYHAVAMIEAREGDWREAEQHFRRAIELDPNQSNTYVDYAYWLLAVTGRFGESLRVLEAAGRADPLSTDVRLTKALVLVAAGRYADAESVCAQLPAPALCLARVRAGQGRFEDVVHLLGRQPDVDRNPETRGFLAYAYARSGRGADARRLTANDAYPNEQALTSAGFVDRDGTVAALDAMAALGPQRLGLYLTYPELRFVRDDPRVGALRRRVGLPDLAARALR